MQEEDLVTVIGLSRNEIITQEELEYLVETGPKKRIKRMPEAAAPVEAVATAQPAEEVDTRTVWQKAGYTPIYERLVGHFEGLRANHMLPREIRDLIELTNAATRVEDFDDYRDNQLVTMIDTVLNRLPRIEQEVTTFIQTIGRARPMIVETDFI